MRQMHDLDSLMPVERCLSTDSTQVLAREAVLGGQIRGHARVFVAGSQTGGVGRFGRRWFSPEGGLWCTVAWPVDLDVARVRAGLGLRVGIGVIHALEHLLGGRGERVMMKWPNDILIGGMKVAGILCEMFEHDGKWYVLVGIGVNGNFSIGVLPEEIAAASTTLRDELGCDVDIEKLLEDLRARMADALMTEGLPAKTLAMLRDRMHGVGQHQTIMLPCGKTRSGELLGIDDDGSLRLRVADGEFRAPPGAEVMRG